MWWPDWARARVSRRTGAAHDRLETLLLIHRYATGKLSYARLEAHLLGRV